MAYQPWIKYSVTQSVFQTFEHFIRVNKIVNYKCINK